MHKRYQDQNNVSLFLAVLHLRLLSYIIHVTMNNIQRLSGWLCLMSHRQRGHLETAHPFTVPCEGRKAR